MTIQMIAPLSSDPAARQPDPLGIGIGKRFDQPLGTTNFIAAYVQGTWTTGLNGKEKANLQPLEDLNALNAFLGAIRGGQPVPLSHGFNLVYTLGGQPPNLQGANSVISGLGSVYGLHTAFQGGGSGELLNTIDSIAAYAIFYWATDLNYSQARAANDTDWRIAA